MSKYAFKHTFLEKFHTFEKNSEKQSFFVKISVKVGKIVAFKSFWTLQFLIHLRYLCWFKYILILKMFCAYRFFTYGKKSLRGCISARNIFLWLRSFFVCFYIDRVGSDEQEDPDATSSLHQQRICWSSKWKDLRKHQPDRWICKWLICMYFV